MLVRLLERVEAGVPILLDAIPLHVEVRVADRAREHLVEEDVELLVVVLQLRAEVVGLPVLRELRLPVRLVERVRDLLREVVADLDVIHG
ncbi:MAG: hypothetical protein IPK13_20165 [Deltaproteobacteria bacterium]|nr:hypothetical protein [Deltaproteobacteria bacterium]